MESGMMLDLFPLVAMSTEGCAPHQEIAERLDQSGYAVVAKGLIEGGNLLLEIFVDDAGDWVALLTRAGDRFSCVKAAGSNWSTPSSGAPA
jgi:hypothetical protein